MSLAWKPARERALFQVTGARRQRPGAGVDQDAMRTRIHQQWRVRHDDLLRQSSASLGIIAAKGSSRVEVTVRDL
jgi:hypothetical protein